MKPLKYAGIYFPEGFNYGDIEGLDKLVDSEKVSDRVKAANASYGLDKLIDDKSWRVRLAVAKTGYGCEKLLNDSSAKVREEAQKYLDWILDLNNDAVI